MQTKISIYQTLPRLFGNKNNQPIFNGTLADNGVGKFDDYTDAALIAIRDLGITHIWFTGILEHGTMTDYSGYGISIDHPALLKGRAGSPYAIKDYYDVDPDLANDVRNRMREFEQLLERTHKNGLKAIIDFVPNHLFRQYKSDNKPKGVKDFGENDDTSKAFDPANNFYYLPDTAFEIPENIAWQEQIKDEIPENSYREIPAKATGNDVFEARPDKDDWYETVKLNYGVNIQEGGQQSVDPKPDTWLKMLEVLLFWAEKGVDGFRCDMAEMVPVEFWTRAIAEVKKKYPKVVFIAEIYNPMEYHSYVKIGGFDFLYDKVGLYDTLKSIITKGSSTTNISGCWKMLEGLDARMLRFLENHDEVRLASELFAGDAFAAIPAMTLCAAMHRGGVMIYAGQEVGESAAAESGFSGNDGRTTIYDYFNIPEHQKWMNNGKFDGGGLDKDQIRLRQIYQKILNFSLKMDAIVNGEFYDLMWANNYDTLPVRDKVYIWLRHSPKQKLLFVVNFDRNNTHNIRVKISEHAFNEMGWFKCDYFDAVEMLWNNQKFSFDRHTASHQGIHLELRANDALILEITPKNCTERDVKTD
jgi:glycosidase